MNILVERIPEEGSHYDGEESSKIMALEGDSFVKVRGDIRYQLYVQHLAHDLIIRGSLSLDVDLCCARCSEFFSTTVTDSDFLRAYPVTPECDSVDITEDVREALLLCIAEYPVCGETCNGLCAQCGKNLNNGACECESGENPDAWQALEKLDL